MVSGEPKESATRAGDVSTSLESLTAITVSMKIASPAMPAAPAPMPPRLRSRSARSPR